ncbi:putative bifunctional diguanylate cyclase/phosphodiesterase [Alteromonas sp. ASW11-130]|uniref:putative bifunctional diguanylate cyclase/phosphodiesterase n=1 Tax=Alteromonas sp. ASW11-130 TaxID=3015775 RepID=UPI00224260B3|nr:GGDEF domain-containing phosphodiesterase [Alteromonas sp. ASW11-130]MCW8090388.1 EAL domain-containing protein [Alteromonas sp. ASW11-130]
MSESASLWRAFGALLTLEDIKSRVTQVKAVSVVFIILFILMSFSSAIHLKGEWIVESLAIVAILIGLNWFLTTDTTNIVAGMMLWTVTIFTVSKAFYFDGLYDTALLLYPFVVIFAVFLGSRIMVIPLVGFMLSSYYFIAYAVSSRMIDNNVLTAYSAWAKANDMAILLVTYGLGIAVIGKFIRALITKLSQQKEQNRLANEESKKRILYSELTGLPNAVSCKHDIQVYFQKNPKNGSLLGFISLHLNNFNWINSTLGHSFGNQLLELLAKRFENLVDDKTRVYHTSNIEFSFTKRVPDYESLNDFCNQIIRMTIMPVSMPDYGYEINCSIGVAAAPFDGTTYTDLHRKASFAVYKAKEDEPNSYYFYDSEMESSIVRRLDMIRELKHAIEHNEFSLYYQPKVHLATNTIVGAEALIRWHKNGTIVPPNEFIPVAEESGLINEIGKWVIESACKECAKWQKIGMKGITVAVNLSPVQFKRGNLPSQVFRALQKYNLDPNMLELEITESLFIDNAEHVKQQIHVMAEKGINFAIDDFGTGYSNLNYLSHFNASTLKIDMSFVRNMLQNTQQQHIVNAIIKMSRVMDLENVAEGVEDEQTARELIAQGCVYGQGYFWSPPVPSDNFLRLLKQQACAA